MPQSIEVLAWPFAACLVLTGIHAYLGIHVISRKVIFVDIALAQIAALGGTVAFLLGNDPRSAGAYWFSLAFAVLAAAVFAMTRTRHERVPQEAVIGLTYAVASALAILLADASPHGAEHLKDLLTGSIVWVTPTQVLKTGILYALLGTFHYVFRRQFLLISLDPQRAYAEGLRVRLWDFLFYLSFGVVITSSVQIAGVLLVFCYLVAPAVFGVMFSDSLRGRLALGWGLGVVVSAVGLLFSYDRPSGPMLMVCFAIALLGGAALRATMAAARPVLAFSVGTAAAALVIIGSWAATRAPGPDADHSHGAVGSEHALEAARERAHGHDIGESLADLRLALSDSHPAVRAEAIEQLAARNDRESVPALTTALRDDSTVVRESAARALGRLADPGAIPDLLAAAQVAGEDEWVRLRASEASARMGAREGFSGLLRLAREGEARLVRRQALEAAADLAGLPAGSADEPDAALEAIQAWWAGQGGEPAWDPGEKGWRPRATMKRSRPR
ncbi:MAG: iron chelate uptake ABC transporter family permease subunit [Candidatus Polarisedimenticolia bacterium]